MPVKTFEGKAKSEALSAGAKPDPSWGKTFSSTFGFTLSIDPKSPIEVFPHTALSAVESTKALRLLAKPNTIAHLVTCERSHWEIRSEPIGEREFGLTAYTDYGKAILAGTATLNQKGGLSFKLSTLYPNITNRKKQTVEAKGECDGGKCKVSVSYKIEW